jgi:two-component system, sensor histidine kinase and response regulator
MRSSNSKPRRPNSAWFALGLIVLVMFSMSSLSYQSLVRLSELRAGGSRTREVLLHLESLMSSLKDAETGQRGYLLTGRDPYLEPYRPARIAIKDDFDKLKVLTSDSPQQQKLLTECAPLVIAKLDELKDTIDLRSKQGFAAALQVVETDKGKGVMDRIRLLTNEMRDYEQKLLQERDEAAKTSSQQTTVLLIGLAIIASLLTSITVFFLIHESDQRRKAEESIRDLNQDLQVKVTELALLNSELGNARDQAQAASKFKSEFVANMSHEVRTPMNGIIGMCNILLKTKLEEQQRVYASAIKDAGIALLTVINDILDFSKIEAGRIELELSDFDPVRVVEGTCEILAAQARAKQLSLMSFVDPNMPERLRGDPERVRQVLINLVSNAIKFTQSGEVVVKAMVESRQGNVVYARFSIIDKGRGLTPEEQQKLFQPFVQSDGSISRKYGGTGLGLSISKSLVELMHGTIGLESEIEKGSTFWFVIPLESRSEVSTVSIRDELRNVRVLIVDDETHAQEILHSYVVSWGMRNGVASSADDGIRKLKKANADGDPYKVVIIPEKSGIDMAKEVIHDSVLSTCKLILLTAFDTPGLGTQAIDLGFKAYITKPVRQSQMLDCLVGVVCGGKSIITQSAADAKIKNASQQRPGRAELILVAEDHAVNQQVAQLYIDDLGFACNIVNNGKEAVEAVSRNNYALVLMDCQMPELDGLAATKCIRRAEFLTGKHVPIIAMTAHAMEGDRDRCIAAGMDDYISKPIEPEQLRVVIEKWLPRQVEGAISRRGLLENLGEQTKVPLDLDTVVVRYGAAASHSLLKTFLQEVPQAFAKLQQVRKVSQGGEFLDAVHGLKGICAAVCADKMRATCIELECLARDGEWGLLPDLMRRLETELIEVQQLLSIKLPKLNEAGSDYGAYSGHY